MTFTRVKSAGGPDAEYDVNTAELEANPDLYVVVDPEPVEVPRPTIYPEPTQAKDSKTSVGDTTKQEKKP